MTTATQSTVFHITHWKAGSQWVREILQQAAPERYVHPAGDPEAIGPDRLRPGAIYSPVYLPAYGFRKFVPPTVDARKFVVIRDLRDTLVSWYFSIKCSHGAESPQVAATVNPYRARFLEASIEDGLLIALRERMDAMGRIQSSWLASSDALVLRYESMLEDEQGAFEKIFRHCELDLDAEQRQEIVERNSFERRTGRKRGEENVSAHHRKGVAGDWRNHFTRRVAEEFKERLGPVLIEAGYEQSMDW